MPVFLVTGATGQQGGAVIDALLKTNEENAAQIEVRALTRNPQSAAAKALESRGVQIVKGDLTNRESISGALRDGIDAAYLVTDFRGEGDVEGEVKQGKGFVECAVEAGVPHLIFSSVAGSDISQPVVHFYSKYLIEKAIVSSGIPNYTIVRPTGFMEVIPPSKIARFFFLGSMAAVFGNTKQKYVACEDIGNAVARAFLEPERFRNRVLTIVGQQATVEEVQQALDRAEGLPQTRSWKMWLPRWFVLACSPFHYRQMFKWLYAVEQPGDVEETKRIIPGVMDIETWAKKQKAKRDALLEKKTL